MNRICPALAQDLLLGRLGPAHSEPSDALILYTPGLQQNQASAHSRKTAKQGVMASECHDQRFGFCASVQGVQLRILVEFGFKIMALCPGLRI